MHTFICQLSSFQFITRPATIIFTIVEKVLMVMGEAEIGLITATLPPIIQVAMVDFWVYLLLLVLSKKVFMVTKEVIVAVIMEEADLGIKRPSDLTLKMLDKVLMMTGDVDIGLRPDTIPTIIQVRLIDNWFYLLMVII